MHGSMLNEQLDPVIQMALNIERPRRSTWIEMDCHSGNVDNARPQIYVCGRA